MTFRPGGLIPMPRTDGAPRVEDGHMGTEGRLMRTIPRGPCKLGLQFGTIIHCGRAVDLTPAPTGGEMRSEDER